VCFGVFRWDCFKAFEYDYYKFRPCAAPNWQDYATGTPDDAKQWIVFHPGAYGARTRRGTF
jgi:hypothetical protein